MDFFNDAKLTGSSGKIKILAVASGGGHWEQMMLLRDMLDDFDVVFATTNSGLASRASISCFHVIPDCNRNTFPAAIRSIFRAFQIVLKEKPDFIITTGALPGLFCLIAGRWANARTIWIDSVANVEHLSSCGNLARRFASICFTQWEHLAEENVRFAGRLL